METAKHLHAILRTRKDVIEGSDDSDGRPCVEKNAFAVLSAVAATDADEEVVKVESHLKVLGYKQSLCQRAAMAQNFPH